MTSVSGIPITTTITDDTGGSTVNSVDILSSTYIAGNFLLVSSTFAEAPELNSCYTYLLNFDIYNDQDERTGISVNVNNNQTTAELAYNLHDTLLRVRRPMYPYTSIILH